jgi:hypothetical protein
MILEALVTQVHARFPDQRARFVAGTDPKLIIEPVHPDFGQVQIVPYGEELILFAGHFTHGHFACYTEGLSEVEKGREIVETTLDFLGAMFEDEVVFWGGHHRSGGWYRRDVRGGLDPKHGDHQYVWSGPVDSCG